MRTADNAVSGGGGVSASVSLHVSFSTGAPRRPSVRLPAAKSEREAATLRLAREGGAYLPQALFNISPKLNYPLSRVRARECWLSPCKDLDCGCKAKATMSEAERHSVAVFVAFVYFCNATFDTARDPIRAMQCGLHMFPARRRNSIRPSGW